MWCLYFYLNYPYPIILRDMLLILKILKLLPNILFKTDWSENSFTIILKANRLH